MTLSLRTDPSHPGGGFALLEGPALADVTAITIENGFAPGQFLNEDGKWGRNAFAFPVESAAGGSLLLGPHIVDHVPTELQIELRADSGVPLGKLFWADVIPSRNPGSVTSAQVLEERRRRAEGRAAAERAALEEAREQERAERDRLAAEEKARAATAAQAAVEAARRQAAEKAAEEAKSAAVRPVATPAITPAETRPVKRRSRAPLLAALLLLALAVAAVVFAKRPDLLDTFRQRQVAVTDRQPAPVSPAATPNSTPVPPEPPAEPAPVAALPPAKPAVDCATFEPRIADVFARSNADKVTLGEEALRAGCGVQAFEAFDASDWKVSEAAAWNLARFYDPNETEPVYRRAASVHPENAAAYYSAWRDRSPRQAAALAKICGAPHPGSAALLRACGR